MQGNIHNRHGYREQSRSHACIQIHINMFLPMLFEKCFPISLNISQIMFSKSFRVFHSNGCSTVYLTTQAHCIFKFLAFTSKPLFVCIHRGNLLQLDLPNLLSVVYVCVFPHVPLNQNGCALFIRYGEEHDPHVKPGWENAL